MLSIGGSLSHPVRAAILVSVLALLPTSALAKKAPWVAIDDPGELFSTYQFSPSEEQSIRDQVGGRAWDDVLAYGNEGGWPEAFDDLEERTSNPDTLKRFRVQRVAEFEDKALLRAKRSKNRHMPAAWQPPKNLYLVIAANAVHVIE